MLNLPEIFYYDAKYSGMNYTNTPTDLLDINRMLSNQPCWLKNDFKQEKKPKILILSDWMTPFWTLEKRRRISFILAELIRQGFKIYTPKEKQLILVSKQIVQEVVDNFCRDPFKFIFPEELFKMAAQCQIPRDQIHILDDYWIERLCINCLDQPRWIYFDTYQVLEDKIGPEKLSHLLINLVPKISVLKKRYFSLYDNTHNEKQEQIINKLLGPLTKVLGALELEQNLLVKQFIVQIEQNPEYFKGIQLIKLSSKAPVDIKYVTKLLEYNSRLQSFSLSAELYLKCFLAFEPDYFLQLKHIQLNELNSQNCKDLYKIYKIAPNLEGIEFDFRSFPDIKIESLRLDQLSALKYLSLNSLERGASVLLNNVLLEKPNLIQLDGIRLNLSDSLSVGTKSSLEHLSLDFCQIQDKAWKSIWEVISDNICILALDGSTIDETDEPLLPAQKLHTLKLTYMSCSFINQLIYAAPHLRVLKIDKNNVVRTDENELNELSERLFEKLVPGSLPDLEQLFIEGMKLTINSLQNILHAAPNIKQIEFRDVKYIAEEELHLVHGLLQLEKLYIVNSYDENDEDDEDDDEEEFLADESACRCLALILNASPNIETLILRNINVGLPDSLPFMPELQLINFDCTMILFDDLITFFSKTPILSTIIIEGDFVNFNEQQQEQYLLEYLTDLTVSYHIYFEGLNEILRRAPNLKRLNFGGAKFHFVDDEPCIPINTLSHLILHDTDITINNLIQLLHATPHLTHLDLTYCIDLQEKIADYFDPTILPPGSLPNLQKLKIDHVICGDLLQCLRDAAPNLKNNDIERNYDFPMNNDSNVDELDSKTSIVSDRKHDHKKMLDFKPTTHLNFKYMGKYLDHSQSMIIEKLSQYLTLTGQYLDYVPYIQDGICTILVDLLKDMGREAFEQFTTLILQWPGTNRTLTLQLRKLFDNLLFSIEKSEQSGCCVSEQLIADSLLTLMLSAKNNSQFILCNPWHSVFVHKIKDLECIYYNPNASSIVVLSLFELISKLEYDLGKIISVLDPQPIVPEIESWDEFIEQGGLIKLESYANRQSIIDQFPKNHLFSIQALDGLFLKNLQGTPCWWLGCQSDSLEIKNIFMLLQQQYRQAHQDNPQIDMVFDLNQYRELSLTSPFMRIDPEMNRLARMRQQEILKDSLYCEKMEQIELEAQQAESLAKLNQYRQELISSNCIQSDHATVDQFCHSILQLFFNKTHKNETCLLQFDSDLMLETFLEVLLGKMNQKDLPAFWVDSPTDLVCSAPFVERNGCEGRLVKGPGGALHKFIGQHHDVIFLIDYREFSADDIVQFNSLLDKQPIVDGIAIPGNILVIGLVNRKHPKYYQGADFYSRFDHKPPCLFSAEDLQAHISLPSIQWVETGTENSDAQVIPLFHSLDWEAQLLGRWIVDGPNHLSWQEGALLPLASCSSLIIQNGCLTDSRFRQFWNKMRLHGVWHAGRFVRMNPQMQIVMREGYDWARLKSFFEQVDAFNQNGFVLNLHTVSQCFGRQVLDKANNCLKYELSMLHQVRGDWSVTLTSSLTEDIWAKLLSLCSENGIKLKVHCAPNVVLPVVLGINQSLLKPIQPWDGQLSLFQVIESTDLDTSLAHLEKRQLDWLIIDISSCESHDLLERLDSRVDPDTLNMIFTQSKGALLKALEDGRNIILKGAFSSALVDALMPLLLDMEQRVSSLQSQLILLTEDAQLFSIFHHRFRHEVSVEEKLSYLPDEHQALLVEQAKAESLSQLRARSFYLTMHPDGQSDHAWLGVYDLPVDAKLLNEPFIVRNSHIKSEQFMRQRVLDVSQVLARGPYVFLTGLSGVGKTSFVQSVLCGSSSRYKLFQGKEALKEWATCHSPYWMILFLDEVNLSLEEHHQFEGLFQTKPGILIEGIYYSLTQQHKLICAGNPLSYGDERRVSTFAKRHGRTVVFQPLSKAVIFQNILCPILSAQSLTERAIQKASQHILNAYAFICRCSRREVLISPRDLEMMALLGLAHYRAQGGVFQDCIQNAVYELGKLLIPHQQVADIHMFNQRFKPKNAWLDAIKLELPEFYITPSRYPAVLHLQERLQLRQWRFDNRKLLNEIQLYGGLGGLVLEGEPGIGKSEMMTQILLSLGYHDDGGNHDGKLFYRMSVSMGLAEKKDLLSRAFEEGAIVLIDEINSSPMMEAFLNALLMGRHPETCARPVNPGFMVIGTQNPVSMAGRRAASTALKRRLTSIILPEYTADEIENILLRQGILWFEAKLIIQAYEGQRNDAKVNSTYPVPCFRDLLRLVQAIKLKQKSQVLVIQNDLPPAPSSPREWECMRDPLIWGRAENQHTFFANKVDEGSVDSENDPLFKEKRRRVMSAKDN